MNKGITILDAFKSLEDLDDIVIEQPKTKKKIKESFDEAIGYDHYGSFDMKEFKGPALIMYDGGPRQIEVLCKSRNGRYVWKNKAGTPDSEWHKFASYKDALKIQKEVGGEIVSYNEYMGIDEAIDDNKHKEDAEVMTIDISGKDMYDKGQAYYYARTGDHVDYEGKRYEIVMDKDGGHKIGYSDTILLKDDDGHVIEVAKKDFIDGATLLKEDVAMTEAIDDYWVLSDGKNPKNSVVYATIDDVDDFISKIDAGDSYWELLHFVKGQDKKVWDSKNGKVVESLEEDLDTQKKCAFENACDCLKYGYGKDKWNFCGLSKEDADEVWKKAFDHMSKDESCELKEEPVYDMTPEHDSRKSFYGKAKVDVRPDGTQILYSYGTPVCKITKDGKATLLKKGYLGWASSQTTLRHVKEFLKQNGLEAGSINDLRKMYPIEQFNEDLNEGMSVDLMDKDEAKEGKEYLKSEEDVFEKVVDVDASTIEELKDSYIGNVILRCPACKTLFYKKPELLEKDETSGYYNVEEKCEHCGAQDGFELVGQVASMDVKDETQVETTGKDVEVEDDNVEVEKEPVEDVEVENKEVEIKKPSTIAKESLITLSSLDELDEKSLNESISKYLTSVYKNVKDYSTTSCKLEEDKLVVEGVINFKDDKQKTTNFILKECTMTKDGKLRVIGLNEDFDKEGIYKFIGKVVDNKFICESLAYNYKDSKESKKVIGKVRV